MENPESGNPSLRGIRVKVVALVVPCMCAQAFLKHRHRVREIAVWCWKTGASFHEHLQQIENQPSCSRVITVLQLQEAISLTPCRHTTNGWPHWQLFELCYKFMKERIGSKTSRHTAFKLALPLPILSLLILFIEYSNTSSNNRDIFLKNINI